ncbi:MAG TPA: cupin domain-containing protein [Chitinophagaceae bacterium]
MKMIKKSLCAIVGVYILAAVTVTTIAVAQQTGIRRTLLQRHDLSVSGREVIQSRIDFDPGESFGKHSHPGEEIIYVIEGVFQYQVENNAPVTVKAGEVLFIPAGAIHSAKNIGTGNASELATYIVEKGKPLLVMSK